MPKLWLVRADGGDFTDYFVSGDHISIGWNIREDISALTNPDEIEAVYRKYNPDSHSGPARRTAKQIETFLVQMEPSDEVLTPTKDRKWLRRGIIQDGGAYFVEPPHDDNAVYFHCVRRPVLWSGLPINRYDFHPSDQRPMRSRQTVVLVDEDCFGAWARFSPGSNAKAPTGTKQQVREDVRLALDTLVESFDPYEAQELVAELLDAMGCEDLEVSPPGPDGGVDVRAVKTDTLVPEVPIFVQVKRYKWGRNIGKKAVRDLRSGITFGGRGIFVTTSSFTKGAKEVAREALFPHIALIDGPVLIDLIREHWDGISEESQAKLSDVKS